MRWSVFVFLALWLLCILLVCGAAFQPSLIYILLPLIKKKNSLYTLSRFFGGSFEIQFDSLFIKKCYQKGLKKARWFKNVIIINLVFLTCVIFMASILIRFIFQDWLRCLIARLLASLYSIWVFLWVVTPRRVAFGIK